MGLSIEDIQQKDGESPFQFMERLQAEVKRTKEIIQAVRGGRFQGRKPNGNWWLIFKHGIDEHEIVAPDPIALVLKAAVLRCGSCKHATADHAKRELEEDEKKFKPHKEKLRCEGEALDGTKCSCTKTPEEIQKTQGSVEWITAKLQRRYQERSKAPEHVDTTTVFRGMRGEAPR